MRDVRVVMPDAVDDPSRPSGGNVYDRRVCRELGAGGWAVREHAIPGDWPHPGAAAEAALARTLEAAPDGAAVLVDGLIGSAAPGILARHAGRLRLVVLVHMPLGDRPDPAEADATRARERDALDAATAVVTTSAWTRRRLADLYPGLPGERVHVAPPGVDAAGLATGGANPPTLLCVAAVTHGKGHDVLLDALGTLRDLPWRCDCVGSLARDPGFVEALRRRAADRGVGGRVSFSGPRTGADLDRRYAAADLLVLASRGETYGMVVTEALSRGLPVVASDVGGVPEALGSAPDGSRPGLLVPPGDPAALGAALRGWLTDGRLRGRLRGAARGRRTSLAGWAATAAVIDGVLTGARR